MGVDPCDSVVDEDGEVWGTERLFVIDASVFPSASGANPMVSTLAIAHLLATRLADRLRRDTNTAADGPAMGGVHPAGGARSSCDAATESRRARRQAAAAQRRNQAQFQSRIAMVLAIAVANALIYWQMGRQGMLDS